MYQLQIPIHLHPVSFHATKMLLQKTYLGEMLIEQTIEFESRVTGLLVVHIFLKLVAFMTKQKSSNANLRVHYLMLKMLQNAMYLDFLDLGQVTKLNPKMQDFKRVLDLT